MTNITIILITHNGGRRRHGLVQGDRRSQENKRWRGKGGDKAARGNEESLIRNPALVRFIGLPSGPIMFICCVLFSCFLFKFGLCGLGHANGSVRMCNLFWILNKTRFLPQTNKKRSYHLLLRNVATKRGKEEWINKSPQLLTEGSHIHPIASTYNVMIWLVCPSFFDSLSYCYPSNKKKVYINLFSIWIGEFMEENGF